MPREAHGCLERHMDAYLGRHMDAYLERHMDACLPPDHPAGPQPHSSPCPTPAACVHLDQHPPPTQHPPTTHTASSAALHRPSIPKLRALHPVSRKQW
jgi:hypothetical protein